MQAGRLRDRVVILNATTVRSPSGHPVETMTEGATIWAEVKDQWQGENIRRRRNCSGYSEGLDEIPARCDSNFMPESADWRIQRRDSEYRRSADTGCPCHPA